jgi:hypothetical protein
LWALAQVFAAENGGPSAEGVRGVTYAEAQRDRLGRAPAASRTTAEFVLLKRQVQYGVVGIYGNVAHGMHLIDRKTLQLSNDFGETLGAAFLDETATPKKIRDMARDPNRSPAPDPEVSTTVLREWGLRANLRETPGPIEASMLSEALNRDTVRSRMVTALSARPLKKGESELDRLERISDDLKQSDEDLREAIRVIVAYEHCYSWLLLAFERLLWLTGAQGAVPKPTLARDPILKTCASEIPGHVALFEAGVESAQTAEFKKDLDRLKDVRGFFSELASDVVRPGTLVEKVLARHSAVQQGKFDQGRRKLPWLEVAGESVRLTLARASEVRGEPRRPEDIAPHEYRTRSADALWKASTGVRHE